MGQAEVRTSFDRCEATGDFADKFYAIFLNKSPEIPPLFAQTEFEKQRKLLRATVYIMVTRDGLASLISTQEPPPLPAGP